MSMHVLFFIVLFAFLQYPVQATSVMRERVYVQTDKYVYLSGELVWMKLYLTNETGVPSSLSKVGYVELLDETTAQVQAKLEIHNGVAEGWMELPLTLPTGNYRLIAYTRYMQNEGETVFFTKTIGVINTFVADAVVGMDSTEASAVNSVVSSAGTGTITVTTERQTYAARSQSEIKIEGLPDNVHSLSVSIAGKDCVLYSGDILQWHDLLSDVASKPVPVKTEFLPEYEGHIVRGQIVNAATNLPPERDQIFALLGFVGDQVRVFSGKVESDYQVRFFTRQISGVHELAVSTLTPSDNKYRVNVESPFAAHSEKTLPPFYLHPDWEKQLLARSVGLQVQYAYLADSLNRVDTTYSFFQWKPDRPYLLDEYTRFTTMEEVVIEFIPSLRFRKFNNKHFLSVLLNENDVFTTGNTLVLLDGIPLLDHEYIFKYSPLSLSKIEVYKEKFNFGNMYFDGLVAFTSYTCDYPGLVTDETTHLVDYEGTLAHRYFYAPSYAEASAVANKRPDYRHTLLWLPEVANGGQETLSVPFSTSDLTGEFQVTVEGITKDGKPIRGTAVFRVE